jgi:AAA domain/Bacterial regulatory protein, arsR family
MRDTPRDPDAFLGRGQTFRPNGDGHHEGYDLADLRLAIFPPLAHIAGEIIVEGLTLLAARPKVGKTWMALEIAIAVATGGNCLGELQCEQGEVLFLALEDNRRRMQRRTTKLLGAHKADWPHIATYHKWPRADQGGADALRKWMLDYPATRLIVVDVLARFRKPSPPGKQSYELDYEAVAQLQSIAAENAGLAIIVVHHLRKSEAGDDVLDTVSGTLGTNAAADAIVILHKTAQGMSLYGRSRDVDEIDKAVEFDRETCRWRVLGERDEVQRSEDQQAILYLLRKRGELRLHDIAKALDRSESTVHRQLGKLLGAGTVIQPKYGRYAPATP